MSKNIIPIFKNPQWHGFQQSETDVILYAPLNGSQLFVKYYQGGVGYGYALIGIINQYPFVLDFCYGNVPKYEIDVNEGMINIPIRIENKQLCFIEADYQIFKNIYWLIKNNKYGYQ